MPNLSLHQKMQKYYEKMLSIAKEGGGLFAQFVLIGAPGGGKTTTRQLINSDPELMHFLLICYSY